MPHSYQTLYVHCVWSTKYRAPIITDDIEQLIFPCFESLCLEMRCKLEIVNGTMDHVHLLIRLYRDLTVSQLVKRLKGVSSRRINESNLCIHRFQWQVGFSAFTVHHTDLDLVAGYIENQKQIHARRLQARRAKEDEL